MTSKKLIRFLITWLLGFFMGFGISHSQVKYNNLKIGDKMPNYTFINLINFPGQEVNYSAFKGKELILDFWSTSCVSCIESWPKLEKIKRELKDEVNILLVNPWENKSKVLSLIEKRKNAGVVNLSIPVSCGDSAIKKLFKFRSVPHVIWISKDGVVKAITEGSQLNISNIRSFLNGKTDNLRQKNEGISRRDDASFSSYDSLKSFGLLGGSLLTKYEEGLPTAIDIYSSPSKGYRIRGSQAVDFLYGFAYSDRVSYFNQPEDLQLNRIVLDIIDHSRYTFYNKDREIQFSNLFTYHLISNRSSSIEELKEMMRKDLDRYFNLDVRWERRKMKCLVLSTFDTTLISYPKSGSKIPMRFTFDDVNIKIDGFTIPYVIKWMENATKYHFSPFPIIDESGYKKALYGIEIEDIDVNNHEALDKALNKYGFGFRLEEREVKVLVISEPEGYIWPYSDKEVKK